MDQLSTRATPLFLMKNSAWRGICAAFPVAAAIFFVGCSTPRPHGVTQVATIDSLLAGVFDGHMPLGKLREHGGFGIGTYDRLDGEMIFLNGKFFKAQSDGKVSRPALSEKTPFACVTRFSSDTRTALPQMDGRDLQKLIDRLVPQQNRFVAFRLKGVFKNVLVRSVPAQSQPYPPLAVVTKNQRVFKLRNVRGTLIGFRCPPFVKGVNVPGYHMHFLSQDELSGGHILETLVEGGTLEVDSLIDWLHVFLPPQSDAFAWADLAKDRSRDLHAVEQGDGNRR